MTTSVDSGRSVGFTVHHRRDEWSAGQVRTASERTDELVWPLPLFRRYRNQLDSGIADMTNLGGPNAGSITAALFLEEFVGATPWAHIDIAGTA